MHEQALMRDVLRKIEQVAAEENAARVVRVGVRFGPLSHFTPEHFREHFVDISAGTIAEGAEIDACIDAACGGDVLVETVEIEAR